MNDLRIVLGTRVSQAGFAEVTGTVITPPTAPHTHFFVRWDRGFVTCEQEFGVVILSQPTEDHI